MHAHSLSMYIFMHIFMYIIQANSLFMNIYLGWVEMSLFHNFEFFLFSILYKWHEKNAGKMSEPQDNIYTCPQPCQ